MREQALQTAPSAFHFALLAIIDSGSDRTIHAFFKRLSLSLRLGRRNFHLMTTDHRRHNTRNLNAHRRRHPVEVDTLLSRMNSIRRSQEQRHSGQNPRLSSNHFIFLLLAPRGAVSVHDQKINFSANKITALGLFNLLKFSFENIFNTKREYIFIRIEAVK
ncbi:MAG: hypothetical protein CO113_15380 [Elusimicrobia bacterium CG_4_9_14_3_um_filter_62_55]|nr:MAG: hypothetical protein COX66_19870 [Elusimicrobia bacterium CG_4_10_14_0_2_um_filter_63_34]PJB24154.1 MAG: hypothetical protein CO113_15380 [Elusimicrobia bacterium CG_4_9_14_3_um_filter_62_55]